MIYLFLRPYDQQNYGAKMSSAEESNNPFSRMVMGFFPHTEVCIADRNSAGVSFSTLLSPFSEKPLPLVFLKAHFKGQSTVLLNEHSERPDSGKNLLH